ncbi:MAG: minor capsid protein [Alphaproteobacteria bacterium]|nr:minor capsid protein [Alphaproteobacteria bacterium]
MSKTREIGEDLYQRMHGFKPVRRAERKRGRSEWYYLDPRYDNELHQIDVVNENSPNPRISGIVADDMDKNPEDYYIWRTKGDNKVRGKHAEREGKIFNWHVPPEGGHPGEDYNCRCWAEPYKPERYADKPMMVDVSGLDMFKELQKTLKPLDLTPKNSPQYAANDKANVASDAVYGKNENSILTEDKFRDIITFLRNDSIEGFANFPYLDSVGEDTVCTGHLITDKEQYSLPYYMADTGKPATKEEIKKEFDKLHKYTEYQKQAAEKLKHDKNSKDKPYVAEFFEDVTKLRLTDAQCDAIDREIIEKKWNELVEQFPNFTIMDWNLQRAIFDVHYQNNIIKKADKIDKNHPFGKYAWKNLWLSATNKDIQGIASNLHINDGNKFRNDAKIMFALQGKFLD